ncbi:Fur family transcriptional regulator [Niabella aurantiaca]|uniref:Fur family transcriptional regulator n=1 Tax=Niabella aurantiaca TaxID=379900 RepID=UPI00036AF99D|nr:transcriptional repressor [Niabella aurantiaca]
MDSIVHILKQNNLSVTEGRRKILSLFLNSNGALAHADIEKNTDGHFDRVTVYRTLQSFVDKGIIHTIPTSDNSIKYALCKNDCWEGHHHDHHVHLVCTRCGNTLCLDDVVTPTVKLPREYTIQQVEVVVKGVCKSCNHL